MVRTRSLFCKYKWNLLMEPDRFQHSPKVYIVGLISMIISMALFGLGAYIFPNIAFGLVYRIPDFIFESVNLVQVAYDLNERKAGWLVLVIIFFLGLIASIITYAVSNRIENGIYAIQPEKVEQKSSEKWTETGPLILKISFILGVIFISAKLFQWVITIQ